MKTRISFVGLITAGLLLAPLAQAEDTPSDDLELGSYYVAPHAARDDMGLGSYYVAPQLRAVARKPACGWRAAQYDFDPLQVVYAEQAGDANSYLAAPRLQLVCARGISRG